MNKSFDDAVRRKIAAQPMVAGESSRARLEDALRKGRGCRKQPRSLVLKPAMAVFCAALSVFIGTALLRHSQVTPGEDLTNDPPVTCTAPLGMAANAPLTAESDRFVLTVNSTGYTDDGQLALEWSLDSKPEAKDASSLMCVIWTVEGAEDAGAAYGLDSPAVYMPENGVARLFKQVWQEAPRTDRTLTLHMEAVDLSGQWLSNQQWAEVGQKVLSSGGSMTTAQALAELGLGTKVDDLSMTVSVSAAQAVDMSYALGGGSFDPVTVGDLRVSSASLAWEGTVLRLDMDVTNSGTQERRFFWEMPGIYGSADTGGSGDLFAQEDPTAECTLQSGESRHITRWYLSNTLVLDKLWDFCLWVEESDTQTRACVEMQLQSDLTIPAQFLARGSIPAAAPQAHPIEARVWQAEAIDGRTTFLMDFFCADQATLLNWRAQGTPILAFTRTFAKETGQSAEHQIAACEGGWHILYQWQTDDAPDEPLQMMVRLQDQPHFDDTESTITLNQGHFTNPADTAMDSRLSVTVREAGYDDNGDLCMTLLVGDRTWTQNHYILGFCADGLPESARMLDEKVKMLNVLPGEEGTLGFRYRLTWKVPETVDMTVNLRVRAWVMDKTVDETHLLSLSAEEAAALEGHGLELVSDQLIALPIRALDRVTVGSDIGEATLKGFTADGLTTSDIAATYHAGMLSCGFDLTNTGDQARTISWSMPMGAYQLKSNAASGSAGEENVTLAPGETRSCAAQMLFVGSYLTASSDVCVVLEENDKRIGSSAVVQVISDMVWAEFAEEDFKARCGEVTSADASFTWQLYNVQKLGDTVAVTLAFATPDGSDSGLSQLPSIPARLGNGQAHAWHVGLNQSAVQMVYTTCTLPQGQTELPLYVTALDGTGMTVADTITASDWASSEK